MTQENNSKFIPQHPLNTAVLFLVFNRLDTTKQVFEAIKQAKPPRFYVAADGARESKEGEADKAQAVRDFILNNIDWKCEVKTLFRESNFGCKMAVSGAIDWFFENEEMGIILEDDCLPSQSFFWFCEELLERYRDSEDIYVISGDGRGAQEINIDTSYSFGKYPLIWGWASWSKVWEKYDVKMLDWQSKQNDILKNVSKSSNTKRYWKNAFINVYNGKINTWDYQLVYLLLKDNAKCVMPKVNLISNIGFGEDATHTFDKNNKSANIQKFDLLFPLSHPVSLKMNKAINEFYDLNEFSKKSFTVRVINKLSRIILGKDIVK